VVRLNITWHDAGAVKITYVDNSAGARAFFSSAGGLSSNLTPGKTYRVTGIAKLNATGAVNVQTSPVSSGGNALISNAVDTYFEHIFVCSNTSTNFIGMASMGGSEIIYIKNISVKEIVPDSLEAPTWASTVTLGAVPTTGANCLNGTLTCEHSSSDAAFNAAGTT